MITICFIARAMKNHHKHTCITLAMNRVLVLSSQHELSGIVRNALPPDYRITSCDTAQQALKKNNVSPFDLVFGDLRLIAAAVESGDYAQAAARFRRANPVIEFVVLTSSDDIRNAVRAVRNGAHDYLTYPVDEAQIRVAAASFQKKRARNLELDYLREHFWKKEWLDWVQSHNPVMRRVYENIRAVAPTIATVLLLGETGTGKGLLARLIHLHSNRCAEPFIAVHCGAIPETLLESELFGHEKGAFTGAVRKKLGKFELARNGTIFLDEIGTITAPAQVKLLQVLQDGIFNRVGGEEQLKTNARIIAASNADLDALADSGQFRKDLFYRLNVFPIHIPPLRDRPEDLTHLLGFFLKRLNHRYGKRIAAVHPAVIEALRAYAWPGNIRELENVLERACILETSDRLMPSQFPADLVDTGASVAIHIPEAGLTLAEARQQAVEAFEREYLRNLLARNAGRIKQSAAEAAVTPRQLNRLMTRYGIDKGEFKP
jgi:DNA-binding NtrC family response regulator